MSAPLTPYGSPEAAGAENTQREFRAKLAGIGDLRGKNLSPEQKEKKLREACEGFESIFIQKMWQEMRNTLPKGGLLHGKEEKFWQDMYDQELSKKMTEAGGIGLADMMYTQLSQNLVSASRSLAGAGTIGSGFMPSAAPLMPDVPKSVQAADTGQNSSSGRQQTPQQSAQTIAQAAGQAGREKMSVYDGYAPQPGAMEAAMSRAALNVRPEHGADSDEETIANAPEVEQALALLRQQKDAQASVQSVNIEAMPAGQGIKRQFSSSGMEMTRLAKQEIGTKLGPSGIRPPLQPAGEGTQGQGTRKVRYTTNVPNNKRRGQNMINTLLSSGAEGQKAQAAQTQMQAQTQGQAGALNQQAFPGQPAQSQPMQSQAAQAIPPLTAVDTNG